MIRYGMVGGALNAFIGDVHRKAIAFDARTRLVAGCFSIVAQENAETARAYGLDAARVCADYREMAAREGARADGIDFVSVTTPNNTHYAISKAFLEAGIHVVCEKPLCLTVAEGRNWPRWRGRRACCSA